MAFNYILVKILSAVESFFMTLPLLGLFWRTSPLLDQGWPRQEQSSILSAKEKQREIKSNSSVLLQLHTETKNMYFSVNEVCLNTV